MRKLRVLDLFSGIGGFSLGLERTGGFETIAFCECEDFPRKVLRNHWPEVPIFNDVTELKPTDIGAVDVICGGFPCQDASIAQVQWGFRAGIDGERTGLWREIKRLAADIRPRMLFLENVPGLLSAGFGRVLGDLASIGYDAEWHCIPASSAGRPHKRNRLWIIAYPCGSRLSRREQGKGILIAAEKALAESGNCPAGERDSLVAAFRGLRERDGVSVAMERRRVKPLGNAVVPQVVEAIGHAILAAERETQIHQEAAE